MITKLIQYIGVFLIFLFCAISIFFALSIRDGIWGPEITERMKYTSFFEDRFYDIRMNLTLDETKRDDRIVLAAIDDESLTKLGRWPWSRTIWKDILARLDYFGAKVVAFDIFFTEPELACGTDVSPDKVIAQAVMDFQKNEEKRILIPYSLTDWEEDGIHLMDDYIWSAFVTGIDNSTAFKRRYLDKNIYPVKELLDSQVNLGFIGATPDQDGIFRTYEVVSKVFLKEGDENAKSEGYFLQSFSLAAYYLYTDNQISLEVVSLSGDKNDEHIDAILYTEDKEKSKKPPLHLNSLGQTKVRWSGPRNYYQEIPIHKILSAELDDKEMKKAFYNKLVFVGPTAYGAHDLRHTPVDHKLPGVFFHMNMTSMLLDGKFFVSGDDSTTYSWIILLSGTILILIVMLFGNAILDLIAINLIVVSFFLYDTFVLLPQGYEIKLFFCLLSPIACYSWTTFLNFYMASKEKKYIKGTFSRFVAPAIVDQMLDNPDKVKVGGEKKTITVFFSDVRDFTSISEKLTPEELSICLNQYMGRMTDILFENFGTLDKYIGDAIVAYWGAPLDVENHAYHAVKASLLMIDALPEVNERFKKQGFPQFSHGIGLNTGECSVGNMGSDKIFSYTALGDNMNLGARAEALCKYYGVQLNITEYTKDAIPEDLQKEFQFRILDKVRVKGKELPVVLWEVLDKEHIFTKDPEGLETYNEAFFAYQNKEFQRGVDLLTPLHEKYPQDKSTKRVLETCQNFLENPPAEDWDGVYTHTTKG